MSYSIALTATSRLDLILYGSAAGGIGAITWLASHYITKASTHLLHKTGDSNGKLAVAARKVLKAVITTFEFLKLFSLYGAGVGFSASFAATVGCYVIPSIAILILGSTFAGVYALSQTQDRLKTLFAEVPARSAVQEL